MNAEGNEGTLDALVFGAMSDDLYAYEWLTDFARETGNLTTVGRRFLARTIWHLEDLVETQLRAK